MFPKPLQIPTALTIKAAESGKCRCEALSIVFGRDVYR